MPTLPRGPRFVLLVPCDAASSHGIDPGSAIVCDFAEWTAGQPNVLCDYEGNRFDSECMRRYGQRALHAAGRAAQAYPTIARCRLPRSHFLPIGEYDLRLQRIVAITDADTLARHLGSETMPEVISDAAIQERVRGALAQLGVQGASAEALIDLAPRWTGKVRRGDRGSELECIDADDTITHVAVGRLTHPAPERVLQALGHLIAGDTR